MIGLACLGLIANRLYHSYSKENIGSLRELFTLPHSLLILLTVILLFLNWGIEVFKWRIFTKNLEAFSFGKAWQSVWMGVCIGNLTPGRLGEFAGRILFFKPENRAKAGTLHFISGICQLIVTILMGCVGLLAFSSLIEKKYFYWVISLEILLLLTFIGLLRNINPIIKWLHQKSFLKKFDLNDLQVAPLFLFKMIFYSFLRYMVFFVQFFLLLLASGVQGDWLLISGAISITYLLLSTIPMISFIEVAVRAFVVILLFGNFGSNEWKLSLAASLLWIINIVIPSLAGYVFLVRNKFSFRNKSL